MNLTLWRYVNDVMQMLINKKTLLADVDVDITPPRGVV